MEQDERGKTTIRKVGMAPIMRDGIEYEFTLVLDLDMSHQAVSSKDRTRMFDGKIFEITEEVGEQVAGWLKGSQSKREKKTKATPKKKTKVTPEPVDEEVPLVDGGDLAKKIAAEDEPAVNGYLASLGWIKAGESYRNLSPAHIEKVLKKWNAFYAQVKAFTEGGAK